MTTTNVHADVMLDKFSDDVVILTGTSTSPRRRWEPLPVAGRTEENGLKYLR
jgi:hypothetical protein